MLAEPHKPAAVADAGVVYYRRIGRTLEGSWTHEEIGGLIAREVVYDVEEGSFEGDWKVDIYPPGGGEAFYEGRLTSRRFGEAYLLSWAGHQILTGVSREFKGIGLSLEADLLIASFQEVSLDPGLE
jgi:hypothetical protein